MLRYDYKLKPCHKCGAEHAIPATRRGPCLLEFEKLSYKIVCLACWHKSRYYRSPETAIEAWNEGNIENPVRAYRKKRRWTQKQMAEKVGVCEYTLMKWETGQSKPSRTTGKKLLEATGIEF
jgi:DNA-binding XRE family transcriptional regulator